MNAFTFRTPEHDVDTIFIDRWSPRSFLPDPIPEHHIRMLFEAARWAPSCMNEQPWRFFYAATQQAREKLVPVLSEQNRKWARSAPLLVFVASRRRFQKNDAQNRHNAFDAGAAWMSLALQARRLGLYAHAMAGFHQDQAHAVLGVSPETHDILAAVAIGRKGSPEALPPDVREREAPNGRNPHQAWVNEIS